MWECVYTYTHTHTAQKGYLDVSPGVGMSYLEGSRNPDGLNFGVYVFVYVYKIHVCMYRLGGGMRSWTNHFFLKKKSKRCERIYEYIYAEKEKQKM